MTVLLASTALGVQRRPTASYDAHGWPVPAGPGALTGPFPGRARRLEDGTWNLALDPDCWPVGEGDFVFEMPSKRRWVVTSATVLHNTEDPSVDYVRATGNLRTPAGTEPAGGTNERGV